MKETTHCLKKWPLLLHFLSILLLSLQVAPRAYTMDPVTMSLLAPVIMPQAKQTTTYTAQGLKRTIPGWTNAGKQILSIYKLPLGVLKLTGGLPFGFMNEGIENTWKGVIVPFVVVKEIFCVPLYFCKVI